MQAALSRLRGRSHPERVPGVAAEQLFACPHDSEVCAATIKTPDKSKTSGVIVKTVVLTPAGVTGPALGITLQ